MICSIMLLFYCLLEPQRPPLLLGNYDNILPSFNSKKNTSAKVARKKPVHPARDTYPLVPGVGSGARRKSKFPEGKSCTSWSLDYRYADRETAVTRVKDHHTDSSTLMKKGRAKGKPLENAMRESFDEVRKVTPIEDLTND